MDNSIFVSLSLAQSLESSLDIAANNMANANTSGFKAQRADFQSLVENNLGSNGTDDVSFVRNNGSYIDESAGQLEKTGNPLDIALSGQGWFSYQTTTGQTAYGRDGRLTIDSQGDLVTLSGAKLLDSGGSPIAIPVATGARISIAGDGSITDDQGVNIGKVGVYAIPDASSYQRIGSGMMIPADGAASTASADTDPHVSQGFIEQSNVQPVLEMTRMMEIQRAYERAMKLMEDQDTLRQQVLTQLGQVG